jgi:hypothetical protein
MVLLSDNFPKQFVLKSGGRGYKEVSKETSKA